MSGERRNLAGDPRVDQVGRERSDDLSGELRRRFPPGVLLEGIAFKALERRTIPHGLKTTPRGVLPSVPRGGATLLVQMGLTGDSVVLENATSNEATYDLWVYL
jgi:hypothetical protein